MLMVWLSSLPKFTTEKRQSGDPIGLANDHVELKFDASKGTLSHIKLKSSATEWELKVDFATYGSKYSCQLP